jgi:hypothetical protein
LQYNDSCELTTQEAIAQAFCDVIPRVGRIQYQSGSSYVDITGTLYVLKGTSVTFKAIPSPESASWPVGSPVWSGSSGASGINPTTSVTFNTASANTTNYKTVTASSGYSSVTVYIIVYELTGTLVPQDNFMDRSLSTYGIAELVDLNFTTTPSLTTSQTGDLTWKRISGNGNIPVTTNGVSTYTAPAAPSTDILKLEVINGPSKGLGPSYIKTVVAPSGATTRQLSNTNIGHTNGQCDIAMAMQVFLIPTDVSFDRIVFWEGTAIGNGSGYYSFLNNSVHNPNGPSDVRNCNAMLGCEAFQDSVGDPLDPINHPRNPPCTTGDFYWDIPWQYQATISSPLVQFMIATHHQYTRPMDKAYVEKAGTGPFMKRVSDPTSTVFP